MSDLSNQTPADTYKGLLQVNDYTDGVAGNTGSNALAIQDGAGNATALAVSTDSVGIGTTSPSDSLEVISNGDAFGATITNATANPARLTLTNTEGSAFIDSNNNLLRFGNNTAQDIVIDSGGNVGIGTTSPEFNLSIVDSTDAVIQLKGTDLGRVYFGDTADNNIGRIQYYHVDNSMQFWTNDAEQMRIDSDGNVGIGTTNPRYGLEVHSSNGSGIGLKGSSDTNDGWRLKPSGNDLQIVQSLITNGEVLTLQDGGNVGIGTTSPDYKLDVQESTNGTYAAKIFNNGGDSYGLLVKTSSGIDEDFPILDLENTAGNVFRVQADGNVGIGTTNPSEKLHVSGNAIITGDLNVSGTTTTINTQTLSVEDHQIILGTLSSGTPTDLTADDGGIVLKGDTDKTILWSNDADAWRCNQNFIADGNVGIGTTSPDYKLHIASASPYIEIKDTNSIDENAITAIRFANETQGVSALHAYIGRAGSQDFRIFNTGDITFATGGVSTTDVKMRIDSGGNVGIGTTDPDGKLSIVNDGAEGVEIQPGLSAGLNRITNFNRTTNSYNQLAIDASDTFFRSSGTDMIKIESGIISVNPNNEDHDFNVRSDIGEGLFVQGSNGNVGIGTTSPDASLTVAQAGTIGGIDLTKACILAGNSTTGIGIDNNEIIKKQGTGGGQLNIGSQGSAATIQFKTGADAANGDIPYDRMIIDSDGDVGIGTEIPTAKISTQVASGGSYFIDVKGTSNKQWGLKYTQASWLQSSFSIDEFNSSGTAYPRLTIADGGNVGIGATSPGAKLHIKTSNTTDTLLLEATSDVGLNAPDLVLYRNSASPAADDKIGVVKFRGQHSSGGTKDYANIQGIIVDPTNTAEESKIDFEVRTGGTLESRMEVGPDKVEVSSTTGGVVMPRMTTTQRTDIASPSNGEMVYDTDLNKFYGYANNAWTPLH